MACRILFIVLSVSSMQVPSVPPRTLPAEATKRLAESLAAARAHASHVWRDTPPVNADGTVNGYIEIPRGERRKFEFAMKANTRAVDRVMPEDPGGYPVNYGFVPRTISYDGDPFDILVLGPPLPGGELVRGVIVGVMLMEDEKGLDSKVVVSQVDAAGKPRYQLTPADQETIGGYFARYKQHEPGKFSRVTGWGSPAEGLAHVQTTHAFFRECATTVAACVLRRSADDSVGVRGPLEFAVRSLQRHAP
jgi:inorganic pyrophosphatase